MPAFYFDAYEDRRPPEPVAESPLREALWQFLAALTIGLGAWYLGWRWTASINPEAPVFSVIVLGAETMAYLATLLFFHDIWASADTPAPAPPAQRADLHLAGDGPVRVEIFIATCDESPELVRLSIRDAAAVRPTADTALRITVLDDGARPAMAKIARQEGAGYVARRQNIGFKAGNLKNGLFRSDADFAVICDADTRLFPDFLQNTLGYFRDARVAWVQTPHWFYDIPEPGGRASFRQWLSGRADPFQADPGLFFDIIQRRRNRNGASFCCGAGSLHRTEALFEAALATRKHAGRSGSQAGDLRPFCYHVSEDILTSIRLHGASPRHWRSVYHPRVECRMLSPWSLRAWAGQKLRYAGGTFDIMLRHNPLMRRAMPWRIRLHYLATFSSYLSIFWVLVLLLVPIVTLVTGIAPVSAYSTEFFMRLIPLLVVNELALIVGCWGHDPTYGTRQNLAALQINLRALWLVLRGREIRFAPTPKTPGGAASLRYCRLHLALIGTGFAAVIWAVLRLWLRPGTVDATLVLVNTFWIGWNSYALAAPILAGFWRPPHGAGACTAQATEG